MYEHRLAKRLASPAGVWKNAQALASPPSRPPISPSSEQLSGFERMALEEAREREEPRAPAEALVGIGAMEIKVLRFLLTGSLHGRPRMGLTLKWRGRMWAGCVLVLGLSAGYMAAAATQPMVIGPSRAFEYLGYAAAIVWPCCGWVAAECTAQMAGTLPLPPEDNARLDRADTAQGGGSTTTSQFMLSLLQAKVTPACAAGIGRRTRMAVSRPRTAAPFHGDIPYSTPLTFMVSLPDLVADVHHDVALQRFYVLYISSLQRPGRGPIWGYREEDPSGYREEDPSGVTVMQTTVMYAAFLAWPIGVLQTAGWLLFLQVPTAIAGDLIDQSTRHVRAMHHTRCNWNEVMGHVQASQK